MRFDFSPPEESGRPGERGRAELLELLEEALREAGGGLAAELVEATGPPTRAVGEAAIEADVGSLYYTAEKAYAELARETPARAAAFLAEARGGGDEAELRRLLGGTRLAGVEVRAGPDEQRHEAFLRSGHRRRRQPEGIVRDRGRWEAWVAALKRRLGSARKGWADAARDLGTGASGWTAEGGARKGQAEVERSSAGVMVTLVNLVRHAPYVMDAGARRRAVERARRKVLARLGGG